MAKLLAAAIQPSANTNSQERQGLPVEAVVAPSIGTSQSSPTTGGSLVTHDFPSAGRSTFGVTARAAGRINAAAASREELEALLDERQKLLDLKFAGQISKSQSNKLAYVRWSIDRILDARHGEALDRLDQQASALENLSKEIKDFQRDLAKHVRNKAAR